MTTAKQLQPWVWLGPRWASRTPEFKSRVRYLSYVTFGKFPRLSEPLLPLL